MQANGSLESGLGGDPEKKAKRPKSTRGASWDLLGERAEWEEYNVADASVENLRYAQGDVGTNKVSCRVIEVAVTKLIDCSLVDYTTGP
jgi:hypothetical protein